MGSSFPAREPSNSSYTPLPALTQASVPPSLCFHMHACTHQSPKSSGHLQMLLKIFHHEEWKRKHTRRPGWTVDLHVETLLLSDWILKIGFMPLMSELEGVEDNLVSKWVSGHQGLCDETLVSKVNEKQVNKQVKGLDSVKKLKPLLLPWAPET